MRTTRGNPDDDLKKNLNKSKEIEINDIYPQYITIILKAGNVCNIKNDIVYVLQHGRIDCHKNWTV